MWLSNALKKLAKACLVIAISLALVLIANRSTEGRLHAQSTPEWASPETLKNLRGNPQEVLEISLSFNRDSSPQFRVNGYKIKETYPPKNIGKDGNYRLEILT